MISAAVPAIFADNPGARSTGRDGAERQLGAVSFDRIRSFRFSRQIRFDRNRRIEAIWQQVAGNSLLGRVHDLVSQQSAVPAYRRTVPVCARRMDTANPRENVEMVSQAGTARNNSTEFEKLKSHIHGKLV